MDYKTFIERKSQIGNAAGFEPLWMPKFLFDFQRHLVDWAIRQGRAAIFADCGLGKGQPPESPVLTPSGWIKIGSLNPGDDVIASDGKPYPVLGVYPKTEQDTYRVHFSDGSSMVVDSDHLHICRTNNDRQRGRSWRVLSTSELLSVPLRYGQNGKSRNYDIPIVGDVEFAWNELPIDPYLLGILLGDGHMKGNVSLSSVDDQILHEVEARLPAGVMLQHKSGCDWKLMTGSTGNQRHPFRQTLADLGLLGHLSASKFIPELYLFSGIESRLSMLRGLMDTDGYVDKGGTCQFYSVSKKLASGVVHLLRSLGGIPTQSVKQTFCNGKPGQPCHVVTFSLSRHNPFLLSRKAKRWNQSPRDNGRWIDRIEFEKRQPTVCIAVDSPDSSYVTEHFIVTHNTPMQLVCAENIVRKTNKPVLILTPLAVAGQTVREADKFGIECHRSNDGKLQGKIIVTNYERLHYFKESDFVGVVCDESSSIKAMDGKRRAEVTEFMRTIPYRLLCTATAAPNDYVELGTSSEALGEMGQRDMITMFFKEEIKKDFLGWGRKKYRMKGHAEVAFWRWVCSWARACRRPSDLGFSDDKFILPELKEQEHVVKSRTVTPGFLFEMPANDMREEQAERRRTIEERCEKVAELVAHERPAIVWCHLNPEGDLLAKLISDGQQVKGSDSLEKKEEAYEAFASGQLRVLIIKPKIGAWGLNWQHCSHVVTFASHSYEQYYQAIRRCWRFGQTRPVQVDFVVTEGEQRVAANLEAKSKAADRMFSSLVLHMNDAGRLARSQKFSVQERMPEWLSTARN